MENQLSFSYKDIYLAHYNLYGVAEMFRNYSSFPVKVVFERMKRVWLSDIVS